MRLKAIPAPVSCVLVFASLLSVSARQRPQRPTFSVKVDLVRVDVSVTRRNRPVGGLTTADFVVYDNGARQQLQPVAAEEVPLEAWLVLDTSGSVRPKLPQLVQAASLFRILEEIRARYVLSYYPTSVAPGWHKVEVKLARARGDVRARRGYWLDATR